MTVTRQQVSLGALALVLCLALPMGVLSLLAPTTTGEEVEVSDTIVLARVAAMQLVPDGAGTVVELAIDHHFAGRSLPRRTSLLVEGRPQVEVGDLVVALLGANPPAIHGAYQVQKDPVTLEYVVVTPITGMYAQGVSDVPPVSLTLFADAILARRGLPPQRAPLSWRGTARSAHVFGESRGRAGWSQRGKGKAAPGDEGSSGGGEQATAGVPADAFEPNDDLASASPLVLGLPTVVTGMPLLVTGLTITSGDVDYFSFDGPGLAILHAETRLPAGTTSLQLDTLLGLFLQGSGELLAFDDDGGAGKMSRLVVPLEQRQGPFAVAVESAPDSDLDFDGQEGTTTGPYELLLELEKASYVSNEKDLVAGVSTDGTFIEDFVGFKEVGGLDVLNAGVPADGWGLAYSADLPGGLTGIFAGAGDFLDTPSFNTDVGAISFSLGAFEDSNGFNRHGSATAKSIVAYQSQPRRGVVLTQQYKVGLNQRTVKGELGMKVATDHDLAALTYERVLDVDLFGEGPDTFIYRFDPAHPAKVFPVDTNVGVGGLAGAVPAQDAGTVDGDKQVAILVQYDDQPAGTFEDLAILHTAFVLVSEFALESSAIEQATQNLFAAGMRSWVIAVDKDPDSGLYTAFGVGVQMRDR